MKRCLAAIIAAQMLLTSCAVRGSASGPSDVYAAAKMSQLLVPAPCPAAEAIDPLSGIEGWAPGAGKAAKMGQTAAQNFGGFGGALAGGAQTPTPAPTSAPLNCRELSPDASQMFAGAASDREQLPMTGYDVNARAALYHDAAGAYAYVRDHVHTDAYAGSMRGAQGTLMARAGSPADKALLLAALLQAQRIAVRFAHTSLSDADAARVVKAALTPAPLPSPDDFGATAESQLRDGIASARQQLAKIENLLSQHGAAITGDRALTARVTAAVRDHWWLQFQQNGAWIDADPALPQTPLGNHIGGPAQDAPSDALPDDARASISIRMLADVGDAQNLKVLAQAQTPAADAIATPIVVWMNDATGDISSIASQTSFACGITIGTNATSGTALVPDDASARLRALYLETTEQMAGEPPRVQRQLIVDRRSAAGSIDPAWTPERTAYALTFTYRGMEMPGDLDPAFALGQRLDALTRYGLAIDYAAQHPNDFSMPQGAASDYPIEVQRYFQYDGNIRYALRQQSPPLSFWFDHPQVAFYRESFAQTANALALVQTFDIVDNGMNAAASDAVSAARANATRGLLDTIVERRLIQGPGDKFDVGMLFAHANAQNVGRTIVTPANASSAPAIARDALSADVTGSRVAYAPVNAVDLNGRRSYGWISIDTASGNAVGRMESGAGQEEAEEGILLKVLKAWDHIKAIGNCLNCYVRAMGEAIAIHDTAEKPEHGEHFLECMGAALCEFAVDLAIGRYTKNMLQNGTGEADEFEAERLEKIIGNGVWAAGKGIGGTPAGKLCEALGTDNPYESTAI